MPVYIDDVPYKTLEEAATAHDISTTTLKKRLDSQHPSWSGWKRSKGQQKPDTELKVYSTTERKELFREACKILGIDETTFFNNAMKQTVYNALSAIRDGDIPIPGDLSMGNIETALSEAWRSPPGSVVSRLMSEGA